MKRHETEENSYRNHPKRMPKVEVKIIKEDEEIHHKKKRGKWSKESKYEDDIYLPSHNLYRTAKIADIKKRSHNVSKSK